MNNNMDLWVDPRVSQVKVVGVERYLLARGWKPVPSPRPQLVLFEESPRRRRKPIIQSVPANEKGSDYKDGMVRVITNLAAIENRYAVDVLDEILRLQADAETNGAAKDAPRRAKVKARRSD